MNDKTESSDEVEQADTKAPPVERLVMTKWHGDDVDKNGNVACNHCKKVQSPSFTACVYCCEHKNLEFDDEYDCGWRLDVFCTDCGKNFDFRNDDLMANYKIVKKES